MQRNARAWLGLDEHDHDALVDEDGYVSEDGSEIHDDETPDGQLALGGGTQIAVVRPRNFRDAATIGEYYRRAIPVIINLEDMDNEAAWRIIDFASGLILGLCGDIERISRRTFLIVPADAAILTEHDGLAEEGFFNQALWTVTGSGQAGCCLAAVTWFSCSASCVRVAGRSAPRRTAPGTPTRHPRPPAPAPPKSARTRESRGQFRPHLLPIARRGSWLLSG